MPDLAELQRWMSVLIRDPDPVERSIQRAALRSEISPKALRNGEVVRGSDRHDPIGRLEVYAGAYLTRLRRALRSDFPGLAHLLGDEGFDHLADAYFARHPSDHPNLNALGRHFPSFVAGRRTLPKHVLCSELADLEWAMVEAFHAPEFTPPDHATLLGVPEAEWPTLRFVANPSLRLLKGRWPCDDYLQAVLDGESPEPPAARTGQWLAVYRRAARVHRRQLSREEFDILSALIDGVPLGEAIELAAPQPDRIGIWFTAWSERALLLHQARTN